MGIGQFVPSIPHHDDKRKDRKGRHRFEPLAYALVDALGNNPRRLMSSQRLSGVIAAEVSHSAAEEREGSDDCFEQLPRAGRVDKSHRATRDLSRAYVVPIMQKVCPVIGASSM